MLISIVIPTFNEVDNLSRLLQELTHQNDYSALFEILVCDAGSTDGSRQQVQDYAVKLVDSAKGRARQMNAGAAEACGEYLLFLHADSSLPLGWQHLITDHPAYWGFFRVRLSGSHPLLRLVEGMMNWRSCFSSVATGDQGLFFRRDFFQHLGGFPDMPLMEDIAISKLARQHCKPACLHHRLVTSSRRWEQKGILKTIVLMWWLRLAYWSGVKPQTLQRWYYGNPAR